MKAGAIIGITLIGLAAAGAIAYATSDKVKLVVDGWLDKILDRKPTEELRADGFMSEAWNWDEADGGSEDQPGYEYRQLADGSWQRRRVC